MNATDNTRFRGNTAYSGGVFATLSNNVVLRFSGKPQLISNYAVGKGTISYSEGGAIELFAQGLEIVCKSSSTNEVGTKDDALQTCETSVALFSIPDDGINNGDVLCNSLVLLATSIDIAGVTPMFELSSVDDGSGSGDTFVSLLLHETTFDGGGIIPQEQQANDSDHLHIICNSYGGAAGFDELHCTLLCVDNTNVLLYLRSLDTMVFLAGTELCYHPLLHRDVTPGHGRHFRLYR